MAEYKLMGTENPRTGEVHNWIQRDGTNVTLEDVVYDLTGFQEEAERLRAERDAANRANEFLRGEVRNLARYIVEYGDHQYSCHCVRQDGALVECSCGWIDVYQQAKLRKKQ